MARHKSTDATGKNLTMRRTFHDDALIEFLKKKTNQKDASGVVRFALQRVAEDFGFKPARA